MAWPEWMMGKWPSKGVGTRWAHPAVCRPPQADVDVSHLLSILAAGLRMGTLRISTFSGNATPGKTKVSFEQWYHEVQCVKDHYPEAVVWESIIRLLKGAEVDMARYMGATASINHILQKLSVIFWLGGILWSNPATVPQEGDSHGGTTAPQGLPLSWGVQTHLWFCPIPVQCPWYLLFATNDGY